MAEDLTPKFKKMKPAERELVTTYVAGERPFGDTVGGLQVFSRIMRRGSGDEIFGIDENGMWMGAADFNDAPFKVDMNGVMTILSENLNEV